MICPYLIIFGKKTMNRGTIYYDDLVIVDADTIAQRECSMKYDIILDKEYHLEFDTEENNALDTDLHKVIGFCHFIKNEKGIKMVDFKPLDKFDNSKQYYLHPSSLLGNECKLRKAYLRYDMVYDISRDLKINRIFDDSIL
jgi:hypothetical protein